jgi:rare lipoprotein A (peptidoglycan hydrolase)
LTSNAGLRLAALAGVVLISLATALAVQHHNERGSSLPEPAGQWYTALAAPYIPSAKAKTGACGVRIAPKTVGVAHPDLPCGVKLYIKFGGKEVFTQVVDRGRVVPGHEFDVTQGLAKLLGLQGTQTIQWRFAK